MLSLVIAVGLPTALLWVRLDTVWREERLTHWLQLAFATAVVGSLAWWARLRGWQRNVVA